MANTTKLFTKLLAISPLIPPLWLLLRLVGNPITVLQEWLTLALSRQRHHEFEHAATSRPEIASQLLAYVIVAALGYNATFRLVPHIKVSVCV